MGYTLSSTATSTDKIAITDAGGLAIKLTNKTGAASIAGYVVTADTTTDNAVKLVPVNEHNAIGVFLEDGIADGDEAWIVVSGIADVYFTGAPTKGYLARTGLTADTGEVSGQAMNEAYPTTPFSSDAYMCKIGTVLETKAGAGLAKVALQFN